ncbi:post-GPI attachment to proteins factor 3-like [Paramacrobiotus metropolitanus]|uniref:post-GPI attachment to proteins factor 3-like n=1 Tax=Paramacrobiotus metropolitanus TaxID=2943436 RepID=UPI0024458F1E|nr:post-GPI attachment to proteins factor 3-like [Paramacrobiotus metropolitanus]
MNAHWVSSFLIPFLSLISSSRASWGDRNNVFQDCLSRCLRRSCTVPRELLDELPAALEEDDNGDRLTAWTNTHPWYLRALLWECEDECKYECMWTTVDVFQRENLTIPQFYGKWPFVRLFGIQEPASTLFSVLNGVSHCWMLQKFVQNVPSSAPMFRVWFLYGLASMNAWFWSAVFHTRDFSFTEKMDYFSALLGVLFSFYAFLLRIYGCGRGKTWIIPAVPLLIFYCYHVHYLSFVRFDYGYNMLANITVGVLNSLGWLLFCITVALTNRHARVPRSVWKCALSVLAVDALMLLELLDFPPFLWTFDAHSLWHLGTIPLPLLWYRFLIDDCLYLHRLEQAPKRK